VSPRAQRPTAKVRVWPWRLSPEGFRELRLSCLLNRTACAALLGVSVKTVRNWDRGRHRVPWSAVKLLRLLRLGDLGALAPAWAGWRLQGETLLSPEGRRFTPGDSAWWGLLVAQARAFRDGRARLGGVGAVAPARPQAVTLAPGAGEAVRPVETAAPAANDAGFPHNAVEPSGAPADRMPAQPAPAAVAPEALAPVLDRSARGQVCGASNTAHLCQIGTPDRALSVTYENCTFPACTPCSPPLPGAFRHV
jgi:hypothetical protein